MMRSRATFFAFLCRLVEALLNLLDCVIWHYCTSSTRPFSSFFIAIKRSTAATLFSPVGLISLRSNFATRSLVTCSSHNWNFVVLYSFRGSQENHSDYCLSCAFQSTVRRCNTVIVATPFLLPAKNKFLFQQGMISCNTIYSLHFRELV